MEKALYQFLKSKTSITNLVGTRIYPYWLPTSTSTYPVLTLSLVDNEYVYHLEGNGGQASAVFQLDCWGRQISDVIALGNACRVELSAYSGLMDTKTVHFVWLLQEAFTYEPPKDGSENWLHRKIQRYRIKYIP